MSKWQQVLVCESSAQKSHTHIEHEAMQCFHQCICSLALVSIALFYQQQLAITHQKMKISIALLASLATASAFAPTPSCTTQNSALSATRRESIEQLFTNTATTAAAMLLTNAQPAAAEEAEYNELIAMLKARSEENQEANKNYAMRANKLTKKDFDDVKTRRPKLM